MAKILVHAAAAITRFRFRKILGTDVARNLADSISQNGDRQLQEMKLSASTIKADILGKALLRIFFISALVYRALRDKFDREEANENFRRFLFPMMKPIFSLSMGKLPDSPNAFATFKKRYIKGNKPLTLMTWEVVESTENTFQADFSRCGLAETGDAVGFPELSTLFCEYDKVFFDAYDPRLTFARTETIASGCKRCNFRFLWNDKP